MPIFRPKVNGLSRSKNGEKESRDEVEAKTPPPVIASKDDYFDGMYWVLFGTYSI